MAINCLDISNKALCPVFDSICGDVGVINNKDGGNDMIEFEFVFVHASTPSRLPNSICDNMGVYVDENGDKEWIDLGHSTPSRLPDSIFDGFGVFMNDDAENEWIDLGS